MRNMMNDHKGMITEVIDEMLDMDGEVEIYGIRFLRSEILKKIDPIAYREVALNIVNERIEELQYELEHLDPDEIELINEQIADLEDF
jgi:hypothetical protein